MSELGETFKAWSECKKEKKKSNLESSAQILSDNGIDFESKNDGVHLIIEKRIDFWPSAGKWIIRNGRSGRGVFNLLKIMNKLKIKKGENNE